MQTRLAILYSEIDGAGYFLDLNQPSPAMPIGVADSALEFRGGRHAGCFLFASTW